MKTKNDYEMRSLLKFFLIENCQKKESALLRIDEVEKINLIVEEEIINSKVPGSNDEYDFEQEDDYYIMHNVH